MLLLLTAPKLPDLWNALDDWSSSPGVKKRLDTITTHQAIVKSKDIRLHELIQQYLKQ